MPIARRILKLRSQSREEVEVAITLDAPTAGREGGWFCRYAIQWPDGVRRGEGWGVDAVQALSLTLQSIGADLYASPYHAAGQLVWEVAGQGYGFPVPRNIRDLLMGEDAQD